MGCDMSFLKKVNLEGTQNGNDNFEKRILLLGLDNAGKTSILFQIRDKEFKETVPTVGLNIEHIMYKKYSLTMWDVGGQATRLWKHYFDHINAVIFVLDSADPSKLQSAQNELNKLIADESLKGVPLMIYYNKCDLATCINKDDLNKRLNLEAISTEREVAFQECSALSGIGIWEGFDRLITMFDERKDIIHKQEDNNGESSNIESASTNKDSKPT